MSFRNRCRIIGGEGIIDLSIPLIGGRDQKTLMKDVRIADHYPWQIRHWKTLVSCYSRSPWFEFYRDSLEELYKTRVESLTEWNLLCFKWTLKVLNLSIGIQLTDSYKKEYDPNEVIDWRGKILPKNELTDKYSATRYHQVFEERTGFIPHLSILDLVFCEGKNAIKYI